MSDPTVVDPNEIAEKIRKMRRGELPPDAVSIETLRAAIQATQKRFAVSGEAVEKVKATRKTAAKASGKIDTSVLGDDLFG